MRSARLPVNLIGSPINYADRLIGSPITSQSTGRDAILCAAPQVIQRDHGNLGRWLSRQKLLWRTGKLSEARLTQLRALGVDIDCMTDIAGNLLQRPQQGPE